MRDFPNVKPGVSAKHVVCSEWGGHASQTSVVCLQFVFPRKNRVLERPHRYLIRRIFKIMAVLPRVCNG